MKKLILVLILIWSNINATEPSGLNGLTYKDGNLHFGTAIISDNQLNHHTLVNRTVEFEQVYSDTVNGEFWTNAFFGSTTQLSVAFGDLDSDGDLDLVQGSRYRLEWLRNNGDTSAPEWESLNLGNIVENENKFWTPELVDIDNDNDLDLFCGTLSGTIIFFENVGDNENPVWNSPISNYLNIDVNSHARSVFCDIDNDGDKDLFVGNKDWDQNEGFIYFFLNVGDEFNPSFQLQDSSYIDTYSTNAVSPEFVDIDGDDDFDLFIGSESGNIVFYRNNGSSTNPDWYYESNQYAGISLGWSYLQPRFVDIDGDNDFDLFVTDLNGFFYLYRNNGDITEPIWVEENFFFNKILNFGRPSAPTAGDIDNDGDIDIVVATHKVFILRNVGNAENPMWEWEGEEAVNLNSFWMVPELVDIDNDQDLDLFVGTVWGDLYYYENIGTPTQPNWNLVTNNYEGIDYGSNSHVSVAFADIDSDNDLDMFVQHFGCSPCLDSLSYYENIGTVSQPQWQLIDENYVDIGNNGISFGTSDFGDLDRDGDLDFLLGNSHPGKFYFFENIGNEQTPSWSFQGELLDGMGIEGGTSYSSPAFVDLNNDSYLDIISGLDGGGLNFWWNITGGTQAIDDNKENLPLIFFLKQNYPNPFNPTTTISYELPKTGIVRLSIYNIKGQLVETLVNEQRSPGSYSATWNANDVSSGLYFYKLTTENQTITKKMLLLK